MGVLGLIVGIGGGLALAVGLAVLWVKKKAPHS